MSSDVLNDYVTNTWLQIFGSDAGNYRDAAACRSQIMLCKFIIAGALVVLFLPQWCDHFSSPLRHRHAHLLPVIQV